MRMNTRTIWIGPEGFEVRDTAREGREAVERGFPTLEDALARINDERPIELVADQLARKRVHPVLVRLLGILGLCN